MDPTELVPPPTSTWRQKQSQCPKCDWYSLNHQYSNVDAHDLGTKQRIVELSKNFLEGWRNHLIGEYRQCKCSFHSAINKNKNWWMRLTELWCTTKLPSTLLSFYRWCTVSVAGAEPILSALCLSSHNEGFMSLLLHTSDITEDCWTASFRKIKQEKNTKANGS